MRKTIQVKTDDPEKAKFNLIVTGPVEKVVDISPSIVRMTGEPGKTLEALVTITPAEKYNFSILGMEQKVNSKIKAELIKAEPGKNSWQIKIESTSEKTDNLYDVLTLKTDSKYKPKLTIRVYANFFKQQAPKS